LAVNKRKDSKPFFSIITVVFNGEKYIEETINSVLGQKFVDFEYIIIDGNSSDRTLDIIRKYNDKIDYWLSEKDGGIYEAMNKGAEMVRGDYLYFLNAGDYFYDKNILDKVFRFLDGKNDLLVGNVIREYCSYNSVFSLEGNSLRNIKYGKMPPHQGSFIKKDVFDELGGYNTSYRSSGDLEFFCRFYKKSYSYKVVNENIAFMPSGGMSSNKNISVNESYHVIKKHFGKFYAYLYYFKKMIIEQGIKRILISSGLGNIYEKLLKVKMKGFDKN
jgi:glycosyltransferase involved in cell wall biosynthesis